ncbi:hypothetical protein [Parapedobacter indicus]|uniref:Uncharacterized protein n=1 Tax=Parapedobacter indicus TaxID=1477437 RepID=A0A1I3D044_9SPHI|nr:hypothetical protein [Parapedobacter indicus]PPL04471.1 hypothetical protein CLV26_101273 [Parapedobacter indicus]SFH80087.1 hypothetical protein SAMN05444682_101260 [Parapedobacter indicus]
MLRHQNIPVEKKALIFALDDVLFPKKDYLLQVYYLFAHLLEYTETTPPAKDLTEFLKSAYMHHGEPGLFERAAEVFGIAGKYRVHFDRLHLTAKLPLKLLLYKPITDAMRTAHESGKQVFILAGGNPALQLNKLRHVEWEGLDRVVKVYFEEELINQQQEPMVYLLAENGLEVQDVLYIHARDERNLTRVADVDTLDVERILTTPFVGTD